MFIKITRALSNRGRCRKCFKSLGKGEVVAATLNSWGSYNYTCKPCAIEIMNSAVSELHRMP